MRETAANFPHWPSFKIQLSSTYYELDFFGLDLRCHQQVNSGGGGGEGSIHETRYMAQDHFARVYAPLKGSIPAFIALDRITI